MGCKHRSVGRVEVGAEAGGPGALEPHGGRRGLSNCDEAPGDQAREWRGTVPAGEAAACA
jgi:hypothetical protein